MPNNLILTVEINTTTGIKHFQLSLFENHVFEMPSISIKEDEPVRFKLSSDIQLIEPTIILQDIPIYPKETSSSATEYIYYWYNENNDRNPIFRNHFGLCQIALNIPIIDGQEKTYYTLVEIYATKINAENAERMLLFLESRMEDIIRACFSTTSQKLGDKEGQSNHPSFILQQARKILTAISTLLPAFQFRPITKVRPEILEIELDKATVIGENTISYLCEQPDILKPAFCDNDQNIIRVKNKHYSVDKIKSEILKNETDVYENQVVHGFIQDIIYTLNCIKNMLENLLASLETTSINTEIPIGYQGFDSIRRAFGHRYYSKLLFECKNIIGQYYNYKMLFEKYIPTSCVYAKKPQMTMGFRSNPHYRQIFSLIYQWWQFGKPTPVGDQFLLSIRTLDKLFEFYCLFQLVDALKGMGYNLIGSSSDERIKHFENANPANIFDFLHINGDHLRLFYDYEIGCKNVPNIELLSTSSIQKRFRPDFILYQTGATSLNYLILDAKYTTSKLAFERYLPDLTIKYYHSLGMASGNISPISSVHIIYPCSKSSSKYSTVYKSFHNSQFSLISEKPAIPILGTIPILSDENSDDLNQLSNILNILLNISL